MNKIIRTGLLILLAVSMMLTAATAGEVIISEREKASRLADKAMEEKYGITLLTQEYFNRNTADEGNGRFVVQYWGIEDWGFVLGNYKVVVDNGKVTEISWSHDGEDTSGGMNADAWGNEQILEMLLMNQESGETSQFDEKIQEINQKHGITDFSELFEVPEDERIWDEIGYKNVREQAAFSVEEMTRIAMEGIRVSFELTDEQAANLVDANTPIEEAREDGEEDEDTEYYMFHGAPCYMANIMLAENDQAKIPGQLRYKEKDGYYWVYINVVTGVVEEIFYIAGIGGNG